jgi:hypothetical protein
VVVAGYYRAGAAGINVSYFIGDAHVSGAVSPD